MIKRAMILIVMVIFSAGISYGGVDLTKANITGTFQLKPGQSMSGALFYVYNLAKGPVPSYDKYWRVPDHLIALENDGRFSVELAEGTYCIGAVQRQQGASRIGPPETGDFLLISLDDKGQPVKYQVKVGGRIDVGTISGARQIKAPFLVAGSTAIEGSIHDAEGKPVEGAMAFAFLTPTITGKALFVSERSSREGKFVLPVYEGGTYYVKVRDSFGGGPPQAGKMMDGNKEEPLSQMSVKTGERANIGILKVKKFPGRGPN